jgi:Flp pilus assembly protein TadG
METAMVLPSLLLVLALALGAVATAAAQLSCADAARVGARALARGESHERARALALSAAPDDAAADLALDADTAEVTVRVEFRVVPGLSLPVRAGATAPREPEA